MTEKQAREKGLTFTGVYSSSADREIIDTKLDELKVKYPTAKFYKVKHNCTGMPIYADKIYLAHKTIENSEQYINVAYPSSVEYIQKKYNDELAKLQEQFTSHQKALFDAKLLLAETK